MPVITCPTCGTKLEIAAAQMGEEVQCGGCQQVFTAKDDRGAGRSRKSKYGRDEGEDDRRPRRSKYRRDDEDDDEDYDYDPRPRRTGGRNPGTGMGVAALILGISAVVMAICCWPVGGVCAVLAIIFGCVSLNTEGRGMGIAGLVIGVLSILLAVVVLAAWGGLNLFGRMAAPPPVQPARVKGF